MQEPSLADTLAFEAWPEEQQALARRAIAADIDAAWWQGWSEGFDEGRKERDKKLKHLRKC